MMVGKLWIIFVFVFEYENNYMEKTASTLNAKQKFSCPFIYVHNVTMTALVHVLLW